MRRAFEDLGDWQAPAIRAGARDVRGHWLPREACVWEPVGTRTEYLSVNLRPPPLPYRKQIERMAARPGQSPPEVAQGVGEESDVILGAGAQVEPGARLQRVVIWAREQVPGSVQAHDGVFAGGRFHDCSARSDAKPAGAGPARAR